QSRFSPEPLGASLSFYQTNKDKHSMDHFIIQPILANALGYAFEKATPEGKLTIGALIIVSLLSWTVIITKIRQLYRAWKMSKKFFGAYRATRDPRDLVRKQEEFDGAPGFEVY